MKRVICVMLVFSLLLSLCGCLPSFEEEAVAWQPYSGDMKDYAYYYSAGLNRMWEEDLLYIAEMYLNEHALLTPEECLVSYRVGTAYDGYYTDERYDPELREAFLAEVNSLIPRLEELNRSEFLYCLDKLLALLHDAHAYIVDNGVEKMFDIAVKKEGDGYYAIALPTIHKDLRYCELIAINEISLEEVLERLRPYISYETEEWFLCYTTDYLTYNRLFDVGLLQMAGVMEKNTQSADFTFRTAAGEQTITLTAKNIESISSIYDYADEIFYDSPLFENEEQYYWHKFIDGALYFRISSFQQKTEESLLHAGNALLSAAEETGKIEKLIVDLRHNTGGYVLQGYQQMISVFRRLAPEKIYVLMDNATFSQAVIFSTIIKQELDNVTLVGAPAGQSPNFFGRVEYYTTPNTEIEFALATAWCNMWEGYEYDTLMPDVLVEQSLQDHKDGRDAVLEYVLK